jgi:hypothetical protein
MRNNSAYNSENTIRSITKNNHLMLFKEIIAVYI